MTAMILNIRHTTRYHYDQPVQYALQRLKLQPQNSPGQMVKNWQVSVEGASLEATYTDGFGNHTQLLRLVPQTHDVSITAEGIVETEDRAGILGKIYGIAPLWLFERETDLTRSGEALTAFAASFGIGNDRLGAMHRLMNVIHEKVVYLPGATDSSTDAEAAFINGHGVCQDHTHIFLSIARQLHIPARYVSGYLMLEGVEAQTASHAWAEVHLDDLGWVGFDAANNICPTERYVRLATGLDYRDAAPVSGIRFGSGIESLAVHVNVAQ